ncbi:MAG: tRNA pseudouridine(55) synthase TruB [Sphingomonas fennica]
MDGWLILDKPLGLGSTQAVSAVKRALRRCGCAKVKVGHGGTLDPLATGVLPIALGEATKLTGRMLDADKVYDFTIAFGVETDTLDAEGQGVAFSDERPTIEAVQAILPAFTGAIEQVPPAYSALKVAGERAYDRARAGETVELAARGVTIHRLAITDAGDSGEGALLHEVTLSAAVSKGTYIRSLARDIAQALGTVGHVTMLRRTKAGPFALPQAITLAKLEEAATAPALAGLCLPLTAGLDGIPALAVTAHQAQALRSGQAPGGIAAPDGPCLALLGDIPVALAEVTGGTIRTVRGFNLMPKD